jgi:hypothetical protein
MPSGSLVMFSLKASNASLSCGTQLAFRLSCRGGSPCDATDKKLDRGGGHEKKQELGSGGMHSKWCGLCVQYLAMSKAIC